MAGLNRAALIVLVCMLLSVIGYADLIPQRIGSYRVEVTGPGNDYHDPDGPENAGSGSYKSIKEKGPKDKRQFDRYLDQVLGDYRDRFNFDKQIARLGKGPADGALRFVVLGDSRSNIEMWSTIVRHIDMIEPRPAFVINTGDIVYNGYAEQLREYFVKVVEQTDLPFFVTPGNHDDGRDDKVREFRYLFGDNSLNYYFDYGRSRFIFVDSSTDVFDEDETFEWFARTLADTPAGFKNFVATHKPPKVIEKWEFHAWGTDESKRFTRLASRFRVEDVFLGHIHTYSTAEYLGVKYSICGGGGAPIHKRFGPKGSVHQYLICDIGADGGVRQRCVRFHKVD